MKTLSVVPYRTSDELESLRRENAELRAELESLKGETLYPHSGHDTPCRKCNGTTLREYLDAADVDGGFSRRVKRLVGPDRKFEPAVSKRLWRKALPERFRLHCTRSDCGAVYYERTKT